MNLDNLYLNRFRVNLKAIDDIFLPPYKGFALRGVFGTVLREITCAVASADCASCGRRDGCGYVYLFETGPDPGLADAAKFRSFPRPYVLTPPLDSRNRYLPGELLSFEIVLVGKSDAFLPHVIATFEAIGDRGFRRKGSPGRFRLMNVEALGDDGRSTLVYQDGDFFGAAEPVMFTHLVDNSPAGCATVVLNFRTPLRIEEQGVTVRRPPDFAFIVNSLTRRASLLNYLHCNGPPPVEVDLSNETEGVKIRSSALVWQELERFSTRQKMRLAQGGLMGSITYEGKALGKFVPLLRLGEYLHLGKSTTFGLGNYRLSVAWTPES